MSSYVYMKVLESSAERYDRGIRMLSGGRIEGYYEAVATRVAAPGAEILDVGCGTGGVALACAARGAKVTGIDVNAGMLAQARAKAGADSVQWLALGAAEIEDRFGEASLDAVVSCLAFSELTPDERRYVLRTAHTCVRPGGRIVVADEVPPSTSGGRLWHALARAPVTAWTWALTQTTTRAVEDLPGLVRAAGFEQVREDRPHPAFAIVSATRGGR
jgi:ubiquinone/menaquinone biosynthesis C-methylase UbiE